MLSAVLLLFLCRGRDSLSFLQNLTTNDTRRLQQAHDAQHTCFLNQKGRTLFEASLSLATSSSAGDPHVLVDVAASQAADLLAHLKRARVRAKVDIVDLSSAFAVTSILHADPFALSARDAVHRGREQEILGHVRHAAASVSGAAAAATATSAGAGSVATPAPVAEGAAAFVDSRNPRMGVRLLARRDTWLEGLAMPSAPLLHLHALRVLLGLPEGADVAETVPLEWNLPYINAVSFDKGCYLGQELIARGHFRGLIRKRFVPFYLSPAGAPSRPVACTDPIAAALVHHTDAALQRRKHGVTPGGHGHGQGHGPAQKHDFPSAAASGHNQSHSRIHAGEGSVHRAGHASHAFHGLRLPFPFVDLEWRGHVEAGAPLGSAEAADRGERVGRVASWVPGTNLGFAVLRMERIGHVFGQAPPHTTAAVAAAAEAAGGDDDAANAAAAEESSRRYGWDDFASDEAVIADVQALHARCAAKAVDLRVGSGPGTTAGGADAAAKGNAYHVTPVLPPFWRHIAHAGIEELEVK